MRHAASKQIFSLFLLLGFSIFSACRNPQPDAPTSQPAQHTTGLRDLRYCEIIPVTQHGLNLTVEVYNTLGLNDCPQDLWEKLNADTIAQQYGAKQAKLNGPRHWVIDGLIASGSSTTGKVENFGGIEMKLRGTLENKVWQATVGDKFYTPNEVKRNTVWEYNAGQLVYELTDPDGAVYRMQSYAQIAEPNLSIEQLPSLGEKLKLPAGWKYQARMLTENSNLTANGIAYVINDNLYNSYQRVNP